MKMHRGACCGGFYQTATVSAGLGPFAIFPKLKHSTNSHISLESHNKTICGRHAREKWCPKHLKYDSFILSDLVIPVPLPTADGWAEINLTDPAPTLAAVL
jgi:hypothetical protein